MNVTATPKDLRVSELHASYGPRQVLRGVSLEVGASQVVALFGGNGCGKSTLLRAIAGLVRPESGEVSLGGAIITGFAPDRVQSSGVGYLMQGGRVFPNLSVEENLAVSLGGNGSAMTRLNGGAMVFDRLREMKGRRAGLLSGGERQMLAIEMVLGQAPQVVLMDEPTAGLAPALASEVLRRIASYARERRCGVLLVEQKVEEAGQIADRRLVLVDGRVAESVENKGGRS